MPGPVNLALRRLVDGLGALEARLLPPHCLACEAPGLAGLDLCDACRYALPWLTGACPACAEPLPLPPAPPGCERCRRDPLPLEGVTAVFRYAPPVDRWLLRFKFHQDLAAGRLLVALMAETLCTLPPPGLLVPIPLHPARLRKRGYDQAAQLARPLARRLGANCAPLLRRVRATPAQSSLDALARRHNLDEVFACLRPPPPHVVLFDDVMTTGTTLRMAAAALRAAGAQRVEAWVCARAVKER